MNEVRRRAIAALLFVGAAMAVLTVDQKPAEAATTVLRAQRVEPGTAVR